MESEPGGALDRHTHTPHMYQLNMPVAGRAALLAASVVVPAPVLSGVLAVAVCGVTLRYVR
jgi:hypothetical protein